MRIEEMYLIEAEAVAHSNPAQGKELLENFMNLSLSDIRLSRKRH
ncbi:hypothetical protein [Duncaniella dubosii]|nr:hypothetical protein [Duncaniella dubosii]